MMPTVQILTGDCVEQMKTLADESVQCCVTSPPYWGLRDYGIDGQIGLETSPGEYIARLVEVFREVCRVLKNDGTVWLNLGSSYAAHPCQRKSTDAAGPKQQSCRGSTSVGSRSVLRGNGAIQSPQHSNDPACGTSSIELQDSNFVGRVCPDCGGELITCSMTHHARTAGIYQLSAQSLPPPLQINHDSERSDCDPSSHSALAIDAHPSTNASLPESVQVFSGHEDTLLGPQSESLTSSDGVPGSANNSVCTSDIVPSDHPLVSRKSGKAFVCMACGYSTRMHREYKPKDMVPIPWLVALALQADGWYLRSDIIWSKPNPMPESVTDRPTKAHEYIFLLSKSERYYCDMGAIAEEIAESSVERLSQDIEFQVGSNRVPGKANGNMKAVGGAYSFARKTSTIGMPGAPDQHREDRDPVEYKGRRNKRTVWTVPTACCKDAHFATFPPDLIKPCILAGCPAGGTVLDPFLGSGTTAAVALELGRNAIGIELNDKYVELARARCRTTPGLALS